MRSLFINFLQFPQNFRPKNLSESVIVPTESEWLLYPWSHKPRMPLRLSKARRYYAKRGQERYPLESGLENAQGLGMAEAMIS